MDTRLDGNSIRLTSKSRSLIFSYWPGQTKCSLQINSLSTSSRWKPFSDWRRKAFLKKSRNRELERIILHCGAIMLQKEDTVSAFLRVESSYTCTFPMNPFKVSKKQSTHLKYHLKAVTQVIVCWSRDDLYYKRITSHHFSISASFGLAFNTAPCLN